MTKTIAFITLTIKSLIIIQIKYYYRMSIEILTENKIAKKIKRTQTQYPVIIEQELKQ